MTGSQKSFFSGLTGVITGVATILSAIVGLVGLSVNQGWIGGHSKSAGTGTTTTATTSGGSSTNTTGSTSGNGQQAPGETTLAGPKFTVDPTTLVFSGAIGPKDATVKVGNTGSASSTLQLPTIAGPDSARFVVDGQDCASSLDPGRSCQLKVTFTPPGPGTFNAVLVIQAYGAGRAQEVPIRATAIL